MQVTYLRECSDIAANEDSVAAHILVTSGFVTVRGPITAQLLWAR